MIASSTSRNDYTGTGSLATYSYVFSAQSATELLVFTTVNGVSTTLVLNTDYSVSQNQDYSTGGSITLLAGNLATGTQLTITRNEAFEQTYSFPNNGTFYPSDYEAALDALEKQIQQLKQQLSVCVQAPASEVPGSLNLTLPVGSGRASSYLAFDSNGNLLTVSGVAATTILTNYAFAALPTPQATAMFAQCTDGPFAVYNTVLGAWEKINQVGP